MRPRKIVSLFCSKEQRRGELRFLIDLWGYCVLDGETEIADVSLVFGMDGRVEMNGNYIGHRLAAIELREFLRIGAARKRGPKKRVVTEQVQVTA